jgi:hypothetical protein
MAAALPMSISTSRRLGCQPGNPMLILTLDNSLSFHLRILVGRDTPLTIVFLASAQPSSKSGYQDKSSPASHHRSFPNDELLAADFAVHHSPVDGTSARRP